MTYDAIIVGGSYAGISAAMQLARARRKIAVIDAGQRRNRFASESHGFLGQDGRNPGDIAAEAKSQLLAYRTVEWIDGEVTAANKGEEKFTLKLADGSEMDALRLVLALGVTDRLPEIPGIPERWGKSVFHCPYCHGYELNEGKIGVIATSASSIHQALMLPDWGQTTFFLNGEIELDAEQEAELKRRGVAVEATSIRSVSGVADVEMEDGRILSFTGLFLGSYTEPSSNLAEQLGCRIEEAPTGRFIWTDEMKQTSVPGVIACGDAARAFSSVALAVGDGAMAGSSAHRMLIFG